MLKPISIGKSNRKGQTGMEEVFFVLAFLFAAAIFIFIVYFVYSEIKSPISEALNGALPEGETATNATIIANQTIGGLGLFNNLFPFLLLGLIAMCIVSAFFIGSHPMFFFISIIVLGVLILLGVTFSNIYQQITEDTSFGTTSSNFSIINIFMHYLPLIIVVVIIIVFIILYGKSGGAGGGGL